MFGEGSVTKRAALSQGSHANWTAWAQSTNGLAVSRNWPNASKEGIACKLMESCSAFIERTAVNDLDVQSGQTRRGPCYIVLIRHASSPWG
jgi:hypothetical protein